MTDSLESRRKVIVPLLRDCDRPVECGKLMDDAASLIQEYERIYQIRNFQCVGLIDALETLLKEYSSAGLRGKAGLYAHKMINIITEQWQREDREHYD